MNSSLNRLTIPGLLCVACFAAAILPGTVAPVSAQQILVSTPFTNVSDSFYERNGVNFGFNFGGGPGFSQGSFGSTIPQVGGYDPNSSARFGFGRIGPNGGFNLGFEFGKGSTRSITNTTPSIMLQNGQSGSVFSGNVVPFVSSVTPVVGNGPSPIDNAVTRAINSGQLTPYGEPLFSPGEARVYNGQVNYSNEISSAEQSAMSVDAIKARRASQLAAANAQLQVLLDEAVAYEEAGEDYLARSKYRDAIQACTDKELEAKIRSRMKQVGKPVESGG